jgi:hypothetical protein
MTENSGNKKADLRRLFFWLVQLIAWQQQEQQRLARKRRQQQERKQQQRQQQEQQQEQHLCHTRTRTGPTEQRRSERRISSYFLQLII